MVSGNVNTRLFCISTQLGPAWRQFLPNIPSFLTFKLCSGSLVTWIQYRICLRWYRIHYIFTVHIIIYTVHSSTKVCIVFLTPRAQSYISTQHTHKMINNTTVLLARNELWVPFNCLAKFIFLWYDCFPTGPRPRVMRGVGVREQQTCKLTPHTRRWHCSGDIYQWSD